MYYIDPSNCGECEKENCNPRTQCPHQIYVPDDSLCASCVETCKESYKITECAGYKKGDNNDT